MIQLPAMDLPPPAAEGLRAYQASVDAAGAYADQVGAGKTLFARYNTRGNAVFDEVKERLDAMCAGARRCAYCEDSLADEVEHVRPKDLYPDRVFAWTNYLYACGPCNGPKGNHYAVFPSGSDTPLSVARAPKAPVVPPVGGDPVLIDPRTEDATRLMILDLRNTYRFTPLAARGTREHERADYTIRTLHLNDRDALTRARHEAHVDYVNFLRRYQHDRDHDAPATHLASLTALLRRKQHPTVWREMKRQREHHADLRALFAAVPEAVGW